ncbi:MAG: hypothetical protein O2816_18970 [Planctomycetota bacterium]|nr:hypothetical protein [Planctomycetota bacterium]
MICLPVLLCGLALGVQDDEPDQPQDVGPSMAREDVYEHVDRGVGYLLNTMNEDGSWSTKAPDCILELGFALETYYSWQVAAQALGCMALAAVPATDERQAALERGVRFLCETRLPRRGADWDIDGVWTALYGYVGCVELLGDEQLQAEELQALLTKRAKEFLGELRRHQALSGGWAYYDDPPYDVIPTWATSFCTALVLPALLEGQRRGLGVEQKMIDRAVRYVRQCALPNGAYTYDLTPVPRISGVEHINKVEGSLGRIQVCNWGLAAAGVEQVTSDVVREGLEAFFDHHGFLDHVRTRPIPHEGFHANAGYFYFFGHYYAAKAIDVLPEAEREGYHARLRPHLCKTQWKSGGASDFLDSGYMVTASTSYLILSLQAGLPADAR